MRRRSLPPQRVSPHQLKVNNADHSRRRSVSANRNVRTGHPTTPRTSMANIAAIIEEGLARRCQNCSCDDLILATDKDLLPAGKVFCCPVSFLNVLLMGLGFMLNVGAGEATFMIQTVVLNSVKDDYFEGTPTLGYSLSAICSASQFIGYTMGPPFVAFTGPKLGMVLGSLFVCFYVASYIRPLAVPLYIGSALFGLGLGVIWTVQGYFITVNSLPKDVLRNTGIFLALYQSSLISASVFYFLMMRGSVDISPQSRVIVFSTLLSISVAGVFAFSLVVHSWTGKIPLAPEAPPLSKATDDLNTAAVCPYCSEVPHCSDVPSRPVTPGKKTVSHRKPWVAFLSTVKFIWNRNILIITPYFLYIGFEQSMWSNLYPTALGYTMRFGTLRESLVGLNGLFVGLGATLGGLSLGLVGSWMNAYGKDGALLGAFCIHLTACYLTFLDTPVTASLNMTGEPAFVGPNAYIALTTSFLFGFGDVIWCAQLMAYLGEIYRYEVVSVFTVYHSWMAIGAASLFGLSTVIALPYLLLIMVITAVVALAGFCVVEWKALAHQRFLLYLKQLTKNSTELIVVEGP